MSRMKDELSKTVFASRLAWIEYRKAMRELQRQAEEKPAASALGFELATEELRRKAVADLYYFGVVSPQARYIQRLEKLEPPRIEAEKEALFYETYAHDRERYEELAAQGFFDLPKEKEELLRKGPALNFDEELGSTLAALQYVTYNTARVNMSIAGEMSRAAGDGYYGPAVCEAFLQATNEVPAVFAGVVQQKWGINPHIREKALVSLAGWVGARMKLATGWKITDVLGEEAGDTPFKQKAALERLVNELPGAVAIQWVALSREEPVEKLVGRIEWSLIKNRSQQDAELHAELPESPEDELEEFVLRETLRRQQLNELPNWVEKAKLSEQERRVFELDVRADRSAEDIARELGITGGHVRVVRNHYLNKIRKAAGL